MSFPNTGPMPWRDPAASSSPGVIARSLPGQENGGYGGASAGPGGPGGYGGNVNGAAPAPARGSETLVLGLLAFSVVIAVAIVVVNLAGLELPGRAVLATLTIIFGPGIPGAILLRLPSQLIELVIGISVSISAAMLLSTALVEAHAFSAVSIMILLNGATVLLAVPATLALMNTRGRR